MTAMTTETKRFAVEDAKIAKMTADPPGGSATYGSSINVPGIKAISLNIPTNEKELRGDNKSLDVDVTWGRATGTISYAKNSMDLHAVLLGATRADSGTTPSRVATLPLLGANRPNYFKIEGKTPTGGADPDGVTTGDEHIVLYKCKITAFPGFAFAEEDYQTFAVPFTCLARLADDKWIDDVLNETAASIS